MIELVIAVVGFILVVAVLASVLPICMYGLDYLDDVRTSRRNRLLRKENEADNNRRKVEKWKEGRAPDWR